MIVGGDDPAILPLNKAARVRLPGPAELVVVPEAGHLFEEPGAMAAVARLSVAWFVRWLDVRG